MTRNTKSDFEWKPLQIQEGLSELRKKQAFLQEIEEFENTVYLTELQIPVEDKFNLFYLDKYFIHVHDDSLSRFKQKFGPFLENDQLKYDNLINICIMVKNAGEDFRHMLTKNLPYMDRYTILDTGSTDNTVSIIKEVLANKRGELYEEPFINFRDSRNRLLDLAGNHCHFNIMLDDSYILQGKVREFLDIVRGDDTATSFSIVIEDLDTMYTSNRVTKPPLGLRYVNLIHEIIQSENNSLNVAIPYDWGYIKDVSSEYMNNRTQERKQQDIDTLISMHKEDPTNPRTCYYIADSYLCIKDWSNALEWFIKRVNMDNGYSSEKQDSLYYISVIKDIYLHHPWEECHEWYMKCYEENPKRSESLYFIGKHYLQQQMKNTAYMYIKKAYEIGIPEIQMSVRKHLYNFHIPKDLVQLAYEFGDYTLAESATRKALEWKDDNLLKKWLHILYHINQSNLISDKKRIETTKLIAFVSPGGWSDWDGETLRTHGLGGSENFTIRYAEQLSKMGYKVAVFCKCKVEKKYEGVAYFPLEIYPKFVGSYVIDVAIINRYPEYIPVSCLNGVKSYFVMHDIAKEGDLIPLPSNLAGVLCISEWHKKQMLNYYEECRSRSEVISYGLDITQYPEPKREQYMFIYPNFPNRGLLQLLLMWPLILQKYPTATLHTFCDTSNIWCQQYWAQEMSKIDHLLVVYKNSVINHGWVNGETLREYWAKAHVWFYPCTFEETCCLTAWEAAASKTLVVTNNLAALAESVGNRGVVVKGDARNQVWQSEILKIMFEVIDNKAEYEYTNRNYEWVKTKSFPNVVGDFCSRFIE